MSDAGSDVDLELFGGAVDDIEAPAVPSSASVLDSLEDGAVIEQEDPFSTRAVPEGASKTFYTGAPMRLPCPQARVFLLKKHPAVEFAPDAYDELLARKEDVTRPCVVRYRELPDGTRQSNTRLVRWSDGRMDLVVGKHKIALNPMSKHTPAQPNRFIYERVSGDVLQCVGAVDAKLQTSISPALTKEARAYLSARSGPSAASSVEIRAETKAPEEDLREVLREEAARRKMRLAEERMVRKNRKRERDQYGRRYGREGPPEELTEDYLNQSDDDEAEAHGVRRATERPQAANDPDAHKRLLAAQQGEERTGLEERSRGQYQPSSDEDEDEEPEGGEDVEDDLNGFIVNEADEGEAPVVDDEEEEEEGDEDDDDDDDDDSNGAKPKREKSRGPSLAAQLLTGPIAGDDESDDDDFEFDEDSEDDEDEDDEEDEDQGEDDDETTPEGSAAAAAGGSVSRESTGVDQGSPRRARPADGSEAAAEMEDRRKVKRRRVIADSDSE